MIVKKIKLRSDGTSFLTSYLLDPEISFRKRIKRPAIIICPGGAYLTLAHKEGEVVAARFLGLGYNAFVLHYPVYFLKRSVGNQTPKLNKNSHFPEQIIDLMRSMQYVHKHADEDFVDPQRIYVLGFSAGAHLAGSLGKFFNDEELLKKSETLPEYTKPRGILMGYPMISDKPFKNRKLADIPVQMQSTYKCVREGIFGKQVKNSKYIDAIDLTKNINPEMPRTFIWQASLDSVVDPKETTVFVHKLQASGIACEYHLFQKGEHGMSLCDETSSVNVEDVNSNDALWVTLAKNWLNLDREKKVIIND